MANKDFHTQYDRLSQQQLGFLCVHVTCVLRVRPCHHVYVHQRNVHAVNSWLYHRYAL